MQSYLAIFFIFAFGNAYAAGKSIKRQADPKVVNINDFFDEHLSDFRPLIKRFRFDPMPLPNNITRDISRFGATLHLELVDGLMFGASNLTRSGDVLITFHDNLWRLEARVFIEELRCKFNYSASTAWGWYTEEGHLNATVKNVTVTMGADLSIPTFIVSNPKVKIEDYSVITINRGADSIVTIFTNLFVNLALPYFQKHIVNIAESTALEVANVTVKMVNDNVKGTISNIDQYVGSFLGQLKYTVTGNTKPQDIDEVFYPYIKNPINLDPKDNPFRNLDKLIASLWAETALIWNETSGTHATQFTESDEWFESLISTRPQGPRPTLPGKRPGGQQSVFPTKTTLPTIRPTKPSNNNASKKPTYDPVWNFDQILQDSWTDTFGNKSGADVIGDIFAQSWNETISDYQKTKKHPSEWDNWWASVGQKYSGK